MLITSTSAANVHLERGQGYIDSRLVSMQCLWLNEDYVRVSQGIFERAQTHMYMNSRTSSLSLLTSLDISTVTSIFRRAREQHRNVIRKSRWAQVRRMLFAPKTDQGQWLQHNTWERAFSIWLRLGNQFEDEIGRREDTEQGTSARY